jgi:hypothetical protein
MTNLRFIYSGPARRILEVVEHSDVGPPFHRVRLECGHIVWSNDIDFACCPSCRPMVGHA